MTTDFVIRLDHDTSTLTLTCRTCDTLDLLAVPRTTSASTAKVLVGFAQQHLGCTQGVRGDADRR